MPGLCRENFLFAIKAIMLHLFATSIVLAINGVKWCALNVPWFVKIGFGTTYSRCIAVFRFIFVVLVCVCVAHKHAMQNILHNCHFYMKTFFSKS